MTALRSREVKDGEVLRFLNRELIPYLKERFQERTYTVATVPDAASNKGNIIQVSDGDAGSWCLAASDGSNWLVVTLGAPVST